MVTWFIDQLKFSYAFRKYTPLLIPVKDVIVYIRQSYNAKDIHALFHKYRSNILEKKLLRIYKMPK